MDDYRYIPLPDVGGRMKTYVFNVSLEPDEDGWRAFYAPLEHIGAATWAATKEDAIRNLQEVLSMIIDAFSEEGRELPAAEGLAVTAGAAVTIT